MPKSDLETLKNRDEIVTNVTKLVKKDLEGFVVSCVEDTILVQFESVRKQMKLQLDSMFSTLETMSKTHDFALKEISYKIGAISGAKVRQKNQQSLTFDNMEEAKKYLNSLENIEEHHKTKQKSANSIDQHEDFRTKVLDQRASSI